MKALKCLIDSMYMEIEAADCYYEKAIKYSTEHQNISQTFIEVAEQELQHFDKFHTAAVSLINKYKSTNDDVPKSMVEIWEFEHARIIDKYDELKFKISKYK